MFGIFDDVVKATIGVAATVVSPVTELVGLDAKKVAGLLALGWTVYEISEVTGIAVEVIQSLKE